MFTNAVQFFERKRKSISSWDLLMWILKFTNYFNRIYSTSCCSTFRRYIVENPVSLVLVKPSHCKLFPRMLKGIDLGDKTHCYIGAADLVRAAINEHDIWALIW